jgi:radical SAM protein with 4Fe4S-binding SPASM domain
VIEGGGEPTIYPRFNDVLICVKDYGLSLGLITNGVKLQYEDKLDCFDWIRVSLDATVKDKFLERKGDGLFNLVMSNIQKIAKRKNINGLIIGVGYVLTNLNEENLEELVLDLRKIDVDYVQIRPVIDHPDMLPKNFELDYLQKYATSEFSINIHNMSENVIKGNFNVPCRAHSLSSVIAANGDVFLCGRLNIYDRIKPIGNLYEKPFYEIWHCEERIKQSKMVLDSEFCRKWCPECRLTKYNVVFDNTSEIKTRNFI